MVHGMTILKVLEVFNNSQSLRNKQKINVALYFGLWQHSSEDLLSKLPSVLHQTICHCEHIYAPPLLNLYSPLSNFWSGSAVYRANIRPKFTAAKLLGCKIMKIYFSDTRIAGTSRPMYPFKIVCLLNYILTVLLSALGGPI